MVNTVLYTNSIPLVQERKWINMINFFKKKKKEPEKTMVEPPYWYKDWERVKKEYPIGSEFVYMGITMLVCNLIDYWPGLHLHDLYIPDTLPEVHCNYVDKIGVLHVAYFRAFEFRLIPRKEFKY